MYCKHCGKEISDDSTFCQYCGGKQDTFLTSSKKKDDKKENSSSSRMIIEIPTIKTNFSEKAKWLTAGYGIWLVLNLYWLFAGEKSDCAADYFQPFANVPFESESYYDISELIVYVIGLPLAVWAFMMLRKRYKGKETPLIKFIKSYGLFFLVAFIVVVTMIILVASIHSDNDDNNDYNFLDNHYRHTQVQTQNSHQHRLQQKTYNNNSFSSEFDSNMKDIDRQLKNIDSQIYNNYIENLSSDLDIHYPN